MALFILSQKKRHVTNRTVYDVMQAYLVLAVPDSKPQDA